MASDFGVKKFRQCHLPVRRWHWRNGVTVCTENNLTLAITQEHFAFPSNDGPRIEINLARAIETTRGHGHRIYARQILIEVPLGNVFRCPGCPSLVVDIVVPELGDYVCDVIWQDGPAFANLLSEHTCEARR